MFWGFFLLKKLHSPAREKQSKTQIWSSEMESKEIKDSCADLNNDTFGYLISGYNILIGSESV